MHLLYTRAQHQRQTMCGVSFHVSFFKKKLRRVGGGGGGGRGALLSAIRAGKRLKKSKHKMRDTSGPATGKKAGGGGGRGRPAPRRGRGGGMGGGMSLQDQMRAALSRRGRR
mmetsp:Transcript_27602/g.51486  ORF Transcript_27602/g.51486 Transcript_27602/m.51486 type:complete len:112 (-) Transcript_27602:224-559(-)